MHPKFYRARAAPYTLKDAIEKDINRLQKLGLEKVQHSDWATPVVPVLKLDGSVRLCGDFKITVKCQPHGVSGSASSAQTSRFANFQDSLSTIHFPTTNGEKRKAI